MTVRSASAIFGIACLHRTAAGTPRDYDAGAGVVNGEPSGIRTLDPLIKSQVLYLLS